MEIQKIEICNLNSLKGEFCIDFTSSPLKGQDIFAITGATGSGKSTILDAITLALYNRVPRLDGKEGEYNPNSNGPYKRLKPEDTENTLTRGEKRGYAKVVFEVAGERYRAEWICELKRVKFEGSHALYHLKKEAGVEKADQMVSRNLVNEFNKETGAPKENTVSKEVVALIGLGYEQFCKACILAQNSFANFLKANDNEKAEILEKVTGTSIYGRIAQVIVNGHDKAVKGKETIDGQIGGQMVNKKDETQLAQINAEIKSLEAERDELNTEIQTLDKGVKWWDDLEDLERKKEEAEKNKDIAVGKERELLPLKEKVVRHGKVEKGLGLLGEENLARAEFSNAEENVVGAINRLKGNQESIQKKTIDKKEVENCLVQKKDKMEELNRIRPIKENFSLIGSEYRQLNTSVDSLRKAASKYTPEAGYGTLKEGDLVKTVGLLTKDLGPELTQETEKNRLTEIEKEIALCQDAEELYTLMEKVQDLDTQDVEDKKVIDSQGPVQKELEDVIKILDDQIKSLENKDLVYKRGLLEEGKACELCGAVHHPYATAKVFNEHIEGIKNILAEKKREKEKVDWDISGANSRLSSRSGQKKALNWSIGKLKDSVGKTDESFRTVFSMYAPDKQISELKTKASRLTDWEDKSAVAENTLSLIGLRDSLGIVNSHIKELDKHLPEDWYTQRLADRDGYEQSLKNLVDQYKKAEKDVTDTEKEVDGIKSSIETLTKLIPGLEEEIKGKEGIRDEKKEALTKATKNLDDWIEDFNANDDKPVSREELKVWKEDSTDWTALNKKIETAISTSSSCSALFKQAEDNLREHKEKEDRPTEDKETLKEKKTDADNRLDKNPDSVLKRLGGKEAIVIAHNNAVEEIAKYQEQLDKADKEVTLWKRFYNMLGKTRGDKNAKEFRKLAQNYTLGLLLSYANEELEKFTKRYKLKKQNDSSLEIMVLDGELGERYASSLSGGETFMVSLALALGLSSISSGSVILKNIFIDEGFGTLDSDTQKTVVAALNTLRTQGKRIGLISHTAALLGDDNIFKIAIEKDAGGKFSKIKLG